MEDDDVPEAVPIESSREELGVLNAGSEQSDRPLLLSHCGAFNLINTNLLKTFRNPAGPDANVERRTGTVSSSGRSKPVPVLLITGFLGAGKTTYATSQHEQDCNID